MKAAEQYLPVVLFIMLYKVVLTFQCVDEILMCDHSNESYRAVLSCGPVCFCCFKVKTFCFSGTLKSMYRVIYTNTHSYFFSSLMSLIRLPLKSLHASLFVVFSICAPSARSMEPNPPLPPGRRSAV